jgi:hypothetical protein
MVIVAELAPRHPAGANMTPLSLLPCELIHCLINAVKQIVWSECA